MSSRVSLNKNILCLLRQPQSNLISTSFGVMVATCRYFPDLYFSWIACCGNPAAFAKRVFKNSIVFCNSFNVYPVLSVNSDDQGSSSKLLRAKAMEDEAIIDGRSPSVGSASRSDNSLIYCKK